MSSSINSLRRKAPANLPASSISTSSASPAAQLRVRSSKPKPVGSFGIAGGSIVGAGPVVGAQFVAADAAPSFEANSISTNGWKGQQVPRSSPDEPLQRRFVSEADSAVPYAAPPLPVLSQRAEFPPATHFSLHSVQQPTYQLNSRDASAYPAYFPIPPREQADPERERAARAAPKQLFNPVTGCFELVQSRAPARGSTSASQNSEFEDRHGVVGPGRDAASLQALRARRKSNRASDRSPRSRGLAFACRPSGEIVCRDALSLEAAPSEHAETPADDPAFDSFAILPSHVDADIDGVQNQAVHDLNTSQMVRFPPEQQHLELPEEQQLLKLQMQLQMQHFVQQQQNSLLNPSAVTWRPAPSDPLADVWATPHSVAEAQWGSLGTSGSTVVSEKSLWAV